MHPELIRAEIRMRGKTLTDVAKQYEISPRVVSLALKNQVYLVKKRLLPF